MRGNAVRIIRCTRKSIVMFVLTLSISGCAGLSELPFDKLSKLSTASFSYVDNPVANGTPILLYSHIARNIKQCWLKQPKPLLDKHVFYATATPNAAGGQAVITLNELTKDGKKGLTAFKVEFLPLDGGKTNVRVDNYRMPEDLAKRLKANVRFWSSGRVSCNELGGNGKITSIPNGVKIKPDTIRH